MLVLTRRAGEQIVIDGNIVLTVVASEGNKVRLGIQAPQSVRIDRAEVHQRRLDEQVSGSWAHSPQHSVLVTQLSRTPFTGEVEYACRGIRKNSEVSRADLIGILANSATHNVCVRFMWDF